MHRAVAPLWSVGIYALAFGPVLWGLRDHDLSLTPSRIVGLGLIAVLWGVGFAQFGGRFVRPRWKIYGKAAVALTLAYFAMVWLGPWGLLIPAVHQSAGIVGHVAICRRHGIDWRTCEPRAQYIALQEKWARGDFH
ncbi:MAG: hypothetical protein OXU20_17370 [Myxococcales bacterium]|nr:hypothetical protein [Myxococcales bacterium]